MKRAAPQSAGVTTALIYTRVSSDAQRDGASLDVQLRECRQYAASMGWAIGQEYTDIASGKREDRPRYQEMLTAIRLMTAEGRRTTVIAWRLDRLGRRILERVQRREELKRLGCETHSATEGGMVSDITANVLAAVAEEETRVLSERVRGARRQLRERGWHPVGGPAWGYRWRDATPDERARGAPAKVLEPDPATAPYVLEAFERVARGETVRHVAGWISGLPDVARGRRALAYPAVRKALRSPLYVGRFERSDDETGGGDGSDGPRGQWSPLIGENLWQRVQDRMAGHARLPKQASGRYLLTGFLRCSGCGSRMVGGRRDGESDRYVCSGQQLGSSAPDLSCRMSASVPPVDAAVLIQAGALLDAVTTRDRELTASLERAWRALQVPSGEVDRTVRRIDELERQAEKNRKRLTDATLLLVDRTIDKAAYDRLYAAIHGELGAIDAELARLHAAQPGRPVLPPLGVVLTSADGWARMLHATETATRRDVLAALLEQVVPERVRIGRYRVRIAWTPLGQALRAMVRRAGGVAA